MCSSNDSGMPIGAGSASASLVAACDRLLDAALDLAHVFQISVEPTAVGRAYSAAQRVRFVDDRVEDAAILGRAAVTLLRRACAAEHALEGHARIDLHRQRLGLRRPGDRVHVRAAIPRHAAADVARKVLRRELERRKRRFLAMLFREDLVDRDADANVLGLGLLRDRTAQPARGAHRVIRDGLAAGARQIVDDGHVLAMAFHRLQDRRQLQRAGFAFRHPVVHRAAVRHVHGAEAQRRSQRLGVGQRRHHRLEKRHADRGA